MQEIGPTRRRGPIHGWFNADSMTVRFSDGMTPKTAIREAKRLSRSEPVLRCRPTSSAMPQKTIDEPSHRRNTSPTPMTSEPNFAAALRSDLMSLLSAAIAYANVVFVYLLSPGPQVRFLSGARSKHFINSGVSQVQVLRAKGHCHATR